MQLTICIHGSNCTSVAFEMFGYLSIVDPDALNNSFYYISWSPTGITKELILIIFTRLSDLNTHGLQTRYGILTHKIDSPNYNYLSACTYVPNFRFANNIGRSYFVEIRVAPAKIRKNLLFWNSRGLSGKWEGKEKRDKKKPWTTYNAWNILVCIARDQKFFTICAR